MKLLFPPSERAALSSMRKKLVDAGIRCEVRQVAVAEGVFGVPPYPQLWITEEADVLKALEVIGKRRLKEMTAIF